MLATEYAEYYGIDSQKENESDMSFRRRVADTLRTQGMLIEAHEAFQDEYYGNGDAVIDGIMDALTQALHRKSSLADICFPRKDTNT